MIRKNVCSATGTCPCSCDYASDSTCTCRDLRQTVNVRLAKSPVYSTYPLTYAQAFNFRPQEVGCPVFSLVLSFIGSDTAEVLITL